MVDMQRPPSNKRTPASALAFAATAGPSEKTSAAARTFIMLATPARLGPQRIDTCSVPSERRRS
jgi:hypothetical protein